MIISLYYKLTNISDPQIAIINGSVAKAIERALKENRMLRLEYEGKKIIVSAEEDREGRGRQLDDNSRSLISNA